MALLVDQYRRLDAAQPSFLREAADLRLYIGATARYEGQARRANRLVKGPAGLDVGLIELDRASDKAPIQVAAPMTPRGGQQGLLVAWGQVCDEKDCPVSQILKQLPVNLTPAAGVTAADSELLTWPEEDPRQRAAKGDSGGPIVAQLDGRLQLVGTLSGSGTSPFPLKNSDIGASSAGSEAPSRYTRSVPFGLALQIRTIAPGPVASIITYSVRPPICSSRRNLPASALAHHDSSPGVVDARS